MVALSGSAEPLVGRPRQTARIAGHAGLTVILILLALAYYAWTYKSLDRFSRTVDEEKTLFCDFVRHYYPAGQQIIPAAVPAKGFYYSAFFAMCLRPLSCLTMSQAVYLWGVLQVVSLVLLILVPALYLARRSLRDYYLYLVLVLLSMPILHNLKWGQVSIALTACMLGAMYLYACGWRKSAALLLSLGVAVKFYPALLAVYFLVKRELRPLAIFIASTILLIVVVPMAALGTRGFERYHRELEESIRQVRPDLEVSINSQYFPSVALRYIIVGRAAALPASSASLPALRSAASRLVASFQDRYDQVIRRHDWNPWPLRIAGLAVLLIILVRCRAVGRARLDDEPELVFSMLLLSLPFIVETSWPHYFVFLPFCQVVAYRQMLRPDLPRRCRLDGVLFWLSILLASSVLFNLIRNWTLYYWFGCLFWSDALLLIVLYRQVSRGLSIQQTDDNVKSASLDSDLLGEPA